MGLGKILSALFATGEDVPDYSDVKLSPEHEEALASVESAATNVEEPINRVDDSKPKPKKGLRKKYEALNIKVVDGSSRENIEKLDIV